MVENESRMGKGYIITGGNSNLQGQLVSLSVITLEDFVLAWWKKVQSLQKINMI